MRACILSQGHVVTLNSEQSGDHGTPAQVDGVKNPKVQSVFFDDMPVHRAAFADGGAQVGFCGIINIAL